MVIIIMGSRISDGFRGHGGDGEEQEQEETKRRRCWFTN